MQFIIDSLAEWVDKWKMAFNAKKCKILHVGRNNPKHRYFVNGVEIESTDEAR